MVNGRWVFVPRIKTKMGEGSLSVAASFSDLALLCLGMNQNEITTTILSNLDFRHFCANTG